MKSILPEKNATKRTISVTENIDELLIENFKSILDLELSLSFDEGKLPNGYNNSDTDKIVAIGNLKNKETRFVPVLSIYGANASGKTNIVKALRCFMDIVI